MCAVLVFCRSRVTQIEVSIGIREILAIHIQTRVEHLVEA